MKAQSSVWLEIATDDLDAVEHCFSGKNYLWALFMCQQSVEKCIKALYFEKIGETPPRKHDLISLAGTANILNELDDNSRSITPPFNILH
ncbi:HEPN domain protein [Sporotomaculum syntrophicum]|uniref:HEPN domain protein n=1 Tax=Sporotomaculum syntrophicum TaxID=182264 RepID=A0A9D2WRZ2_9FIRM|nr:HEPN domain-containing protein [Sporotomaculum syntrophicum]KAF1086284.1 HEPN domain protein [Sporotomaculum syntrophicum]